MIALISPHFSMAASQGDTTYLPERRIHCSTGKILVGNQEFMSASEALFAYLQQFDCKTRTKKQQDAYDLLVARSKMSSRRSRSVENEVKDSLQALRQRKLKQLLHKKKVEQSGLRKEVEEALSRSADLLDRISDDTSPVMQCASDIGSMSTDLLLSVNPFESSSRGVVIDEDGKRKHIYSYRTPRSRTRNVPLHPHMTLKMSERSRRSSVDSAIPPSVLKQMSKRSSSSSSGHVSRHSDPTDIVKRLRSRSASPLPLHLRNHLHSSQPPPDWVHDLDASSGKTVPSWVRTLDTSLDESVWSRHMPGRRSAPSWIHDVDKSDITADSLLLNCKKDVSINKSNLTDSRPGLNFSDLATSGISRYSDKQSFLASHREDLAPRARSLDESTATRTPKDDRVQASNLSGFKVYAVRTSSEDRAADLKRLAAEGTQLTASLDKYLERLEAETSSYSPSKANQRKSRMTVGPKCSSLESNPGVASNQHLLKSDITGASPILKNCNIHTDVSVPSEEPTFTPARVRFSPSKPEAINPTVQRSPSTDVILDGDRSWEQPVGAYKSPVYVDDRKQLSNALRSEKKTPSPTLTGGEQPGSMEALKNMLFRLQAEESSTEVVDSKSMRNPLDLPALQDYNFRVEPGGQSLEKALVHLSRLKNLVQAPQAASDSASTVTVASSLTHGSALTS